MAEQGVQSRVLVCPGPKCQADPEVACPRDCDVRCLHCGAHLCTHHGLAHLAAVHCVSIQWRAHLRDPREAGRA